jgi:carbon-monoxide dehydrogenase medium subunit
MIPVGFDYVAPSTLEAALSAVKSDGAKALSGGQSLIPVLKLRLAAPEVVVDLGHLPGLRRISAERNPIVIGALTTHAMIEDSAALQEICPLLCEVASCIGDRQVRNRGTIGGSLANADPAADWPAAVLALDAELVVAGAGQAVRTVRAGDFFRGLMATALEPGELLVEVRVSKPAPGGMAYQKVKQSASGFAIAGVAAVLEYGSDRICKRASLGITGVADHAFRATAVEEALAGRRLDSKTIAQASARAADGVQNPLSDIHASSEYRMHLARVHCARALARAAGLSADL